MQEHSASYAVIAGWKHDMKKRGWQLEASPGGKGAGVAAMARSPLKLVPHITANQDYRKFHGIGRLAIYVAEIAGQEVMIANVYGYTGGHTDLEAAQGTDEIIAVVIEETEKKVKRIPIMIVGDLNADIDDLPLLRDLISEHRWRDCGACASYWGGA